MTVDGKWDSGQQDAELFSIDPKQVVGYDHGRICYWPIDDKDLPPVSEYGATDPTPTLPK